MVLRYLEETRGENKNLLEISFCNYILNSAEKLKALKHVIIVSEFQGTLFLTECNNVLANVNVAQYRQPLIDAELQCISKFKALGELFYNNGILLGQ